MAVSITQDGPPPNFFMEWIYNFISSGEIKKDELTKADITDADLLDLIDKIETADTTALLDLSERIVACGYTGPLTCDRKEEIVSAVVLHSSVRILPMLQQMCRGLELYGLHEMVKQNQPLFQPLFVPGHFTKKGAAVRRAGLEMTANRRIKQTAQKEMQNKTRSPSAVSCSGLLARGMSPLLLHKEKNLKYMLNLIMTASFDMVSIVYASL
ncbi:hypothetical protein ABG768_015892 [Culter alburnus]|uniref:Uncharacterized protein n=1 Tax=Culter alburnus TaxID=194366 RepID=A0AAW1YX50_CULAL